MVHCSSLPRLGTAPRLGAGIQEKADDKELFQLACTGPRRIPWLEGKYELEVSCEF